MSSHEFSIKSTRGGNVWRADDRKETCLCVTVVSGAGRQTFGFSLSRALNLFRCSLVFVVRTSLILNESCLRESEAQIICCCRSFQTNSDAQIVVWSMLVFTQQGRGTRSEMKLTTSWWVTCDDTRLHWSLGRKTNHNKPTWPLPSDTRRVCGFCLINLYTPEFTPAWLILHDNLGQWGVNYGPVSSFPLSLSHTHTHTHTHTY